MNIIPFLYLGAEDMVTGYDHILFLHGVVFFLYRMKDVGIYVSLFALGHSTTMLLGVWFGWGMTPTSSSVSRSFRRRWTISEPTSAPRDCLAFLLGHKGHDVPQGEQGMALRDGSGAC